MGMPASQVSMGLWNSRTVRVTGSVTAWPAVSTKACAGTVMRVPDDRVSMPPSASTVTVSTGVVPGPRAG